MRNQVSVCFGWLIATSGIHRVLEYSIRYSIEYSSSKSSIRTALVLWFVTYNFIRYSLLTEGVGLC